MVGGLLYVSTGLGTVAALDARTGDWSGTTPLRSKPARARPERTRQTRGVAYWSDGEDARVIATRGSKLVALDATTGERCLDFGEGGEVDLRDGLLRDFPTYYWNSAPLVVNGRDRRRLLYRGRLVEPSRRQPRSRHAATFVDTTSGPGSNSGLSIRFRVRGSLVSTRGGIDLNGDRASWEYSGNNQHVGTSERRPGAGLRLSAAVYTDQRRTTADIGPATTSLPKASSVSM